MGHDPYSEERSILRSERMDYANTSAGNIFRKSMHKDLDPHGVELRESRDSEEHPNSVPIIIGLDLTGSMGHIPHAMITEDLNAMMGKLIKRGITDPQVMFMGIGDHEYDRAPLQVAQFESGDQALDHWLKNLYLEGGGGPNDGESYLLAWYFAAKKTSIDSIENRNSKGFLFTIGDEETLQSVPRNVIKKIFGDDAGPFTARELYDEASKLYHVFHIHVREGQGGHCQHIIDDWSESIGNHLIIAENHRDLSDIISSKVLELQENPTAGVLNDRRIIVTEEE